MGLSLLRAPMFNDDEITMPTFSAPQELDLLKRTSGTPLTADRLQEVLRAYEPILAEIAKLRALDLQDVHPAVLFEPTAPYRTKR